MQTIIYLCGHKKGHLERVNENTAHSLIDSGQAKLYRVEDYEDYEDKMFRPRKQAK